MGVRGRNEVGGYDLDELIRLGKIFDDRPPALDGRSVGWFLAEALLRVRTRSGENAPLVANRAQREFERRRGRRNIVLKARQLGLTTWVAGRFFLKTITQPGTLTVQVAHTQEAAESIFQIVHRFLVNLPEELREGALRTSRANARTLVFPGLDSEYRVETAGDQNAGRGLTIQNLHCSEVARWTGDAGETMVGLRAALSPGGELVMESTANGAHGCFYEEWRQAGSKGTVAHFFPWWWEESYAGAEVEAELLSEEERRLVLEHGLSAGQMGFRRQLQADFGGLARQEYAENAEECFLSTGDCLFDLGAIERRARELGGVLQERRGGQLLIWYPAVSGRRYVVAVDPAGGGSEGDYSAAQVLDVEDGRQCAELQARLTPLELAQAVAELGREYNGALLAVERNNHGSGVLAYLHSVCQYAALYQQEGQEGWLTSSVSRPRMLAQLGLALVEAPHLFFSRRLLAECRGFVRHTNGKTAAAAGEHDDLVLAMAIAHAVRAEVWQGRTRRGDER